MICDVVFTSYVAHVRVESRRRCVFEFATIVGKLSYVRKFVQTKVAA